MIIKVLTAKMRAGNAADACDVPPQHQPQAKAIHRATITRAAAGAFFIFDDRPIPVVILTTKSVTRLLGA